MHLYYLTGFLNEKPLANLRQDMQKIGIKRNDNVKEPEDHISTLFAHDVRIGLGVILIIDIFHLVNSILFLKTY